MAALTRWEPMRELATMRQVMDRMFDEDMFRLAGGWDRGSGFCGPVGL